MSALVLGVLAVMDLIQSLAGLPGIDLGLVFFLGVLVHPLALIIFVPEIKPLKPYSPD